VRFPIPTGSFEIMGSPSMEATNLECRGFVFTSEAFTVRYYDLAGDFDHDAEDHISIAIGAVAAPDCPTRMAAQRCT
jgi:hypothetical protein